MSSKFHGLRTVGYKVADITKGKEWYTQVLGVEPYFDQPFYVGYNVSGYELGLQPDGKERSDDANVVAYWGVDDVQATYNELLAQGASPHSEPMDVGEGIVVASVKDPWGNAFGVIYDPHFKL